MGGPKPFHVALHGKHKKHKFWIDDLMWVILPRSRGEDDDYYFFLERFDKILKEVNGLNGKCCLIGIFSD